MAWSLLSKGNYRRKLETARNLVNQTLDVPDGELMFAWTKLLDYLAEECLRLTAAEMTIRRMQDRLQMIPIAGNWPTAAGREFVEGYLDDPTVLACQRALAHPDRRGEVISWQEITDYERSYLVTTLGNKYGISYIEGMSVDLNASHTCDLGMHFAEPREFTSLERRFVKALGRDLARAGRYYLSRWEGRILWELVKRLPVDRVTVTGLKNIDFLIDYSRPTSGEIEPNQLEFCLDHPDVVGQTPLSMDTGIATPFGHLTPSAVLVSRSNASRVEEFATMFELAIGLTPKQAKTAALFVLGLSIEEIAAEEGRARTTINDRLTPVLAKTGTRTRGQLTRLAYSMMDVFKVVSAE